MIRIISLGENNFEFETPLGTIRISSDEWGDSISFLLAEGKKAFVESYQGYRDAAKISVFPYPEDEEDLE